MTGQGTIVATGAIGYPPGLANVGDMIGAEKVMTMTSTYDHRIIQGAESGRFLKVVEAYLQGDHGFYEAIFHDSARSSGRLPPPPAPPPPRPPRARPARPRRAAPAPTRLLQAVRPRRRSSRPTARTATSPLAWTRWAEPEGDPALEPESVGLTPDIMARIPAQILRMYVPGATLADALPHLRETYCGTIAYEIEHIASHRQRVWLREKIESGEFRNPLTNESATRCCGA